MVGLRFMSELYLTLRSLFLIPIRGYDTMTLASCACGVEDVGIDLAFTVDQV